MNTPTALASTCEQCGSQVPPASARCRQCGTPVRRDDAPARSLSAVASAPSTATTPQAAGSTGLESNPLNSADSCPDCGAEMRPGMPRCRNCGFNRLKPGNGLTSPASAAGPLRPISPPTRAAGAEQHPASPPFRNSPVMGTPAAPAVVSSANSIGFDDLLGMAASLDDDLAVQSETAKPNSELPSAPLQPSPPPVRNPSASSEKLSQTEAAKDPGSSDTSANLDRETSSDAGLGGNSDILKLSCQCGRKLRVKRSRAGSRVKCPECGEPVEIPSSRSDASGAIPLPAGVRANPRMFREIADSLRPAAAEAAARRPKQKKTLSLFRFRAIQTELNRETDKNHGEVANRKDAIVELGKSRDPRAVDMLLEQVRRDSLTVQQAALQSLGETQDPAALIPLLQFLDQEKVELQRAAVLALGKLGDVRAVRPLVQFGVVAPHVKYLASEAVLTIGEAGLAQLLDLLNDSEPALVLEAVVLLGRLRDKQAVRALVSMLNTPSAVIRGHVAESLGNLGDKAAVAPLLPLLRDKDLGVRLNAATALAKLPDPQAVKPLLQSLSDSDGDVRIQAAMGLGEIGDRQAAKPLCALLKDDDMELRLAAAEALGKIGDVHALDPLLELLQEDNENIQLKSLGALRKIKDPRAVSAVMPFLNHDNPSLRKRAVETLGQIGDAETAEELEVLLRTDRAEEVRVSVARALGEIGDHASIDALEEALHDEFSVRCRAIISLGQIGDQACLPALMATLRDAVPEMRMHAANALAEIGHHNARPPLEALLNDENPMVRRAAGKALHKLGDPRGEALLDETKLKKLARGKKEGGAPSTSMASSILSLLTPNHLAAFIPASTTVRISIAGTLAAVVLVAAGLGLSSKFGSPTVLKRMGVKDMAFSADGTQLAMARDHGTVEIWDVEKETRTAEIFPKKSRGPISGIDFISGTDKLILNCGGVPRVQSIKSGEYTELEGHSDPVVFVAATADGSLLVTRDSGQTVIRWNASTLTHETAVQLPGGSLTCTSISADASLIAGGNSNGGVTVWNLLDGKQVQSYAGLRGSVMAVAISPDKSLVAAGTSQGDVSFWQLSTGRLAKQAPNQFRMPVKYLRFYPDSKLLLASKGDNALEALSPSIDEVIRFARPEADRLDSVTFSADGAWLAAGGADETGVSLYDVKSRREVGLLDVK